MTDWKAHRAHREAVVRDEGQWIGLADENGDPLMDLPTAVKMEAPATRLTPGSLELTLQVRDGSGVVHPVVSELVADRLGMVEPGGVFVPADGPARLVVVERPGERRAYKVKFAVAAGDGVSPQTLTIHALEVLNVLWELPCPTSRLSWRRDGYKTLERDPVKPFERPWEIAQLTFGAQADGFSDEGPAEATIRQIITNSIDAVAEHEGWEIPHVVVDQAATGRPSPHVVIQRTDDFIGDTVSEPALLSGVNITADWWLPGDPPVKGMDVNVPVIVIRVAQSEGVEP